MSAFSRLIAMVDRYCPDFTDTIFFSGKFFGGIEKAIKTKKEITPREATVYNTFFEKSLNIGMNIMSEDCQEPELSLMVCDQDLVFELLNLGNDKLSPIPRYS